MTVDQASSGASERVPVAAGGLESGNLGSGGPHTGALTPGLRGASGWSSGLAVAVMAAATLPLAGSGGGLYWQGFDGLWLGLGLAAGLFLSGVLLAAQVNRADSRTLPSLLGARAGATVHHVSAVLAVIPALGLMLAAQLTSLAGLARIGLGLDAPLAIAAAVFGLLAVALLACGRGFTGLLGGLAVVGILAVVTLAVGLAMQLTGSPLAALGYGPLLTEISRLEVGLLGQKLADVTSMKAHVTPYAGTDVANFWGGMIGTAAGVAVLPHLAGRAMAARNADAARGSAVWGLFFLLPVLLLLPAIAVFAKIGLYQMLARGVPAAAAPDWLLELSRAGMAVVCGGSPVDAAGAAQLCKAASGTKGLLRLQDIGLDGAAVWLASGRMAGAGALLSALPLVVALVTSLAAGAGVLLALAQVLGGNAAEHRSATGWRLGALILAAALLAGAAVFALPGEVAALAAWPLPILAAGLAPVMLLSVSGRWVTPAGALAGIVAGAAVTLYYLVGTRYFPVSFHDLWHAFTPASFGAERKYVALRDAWAGAEGAQKALAWQALSAQAQSMAGVWGLRPAAAALLGLPVGVVATVLVSLVTRRSSPQQRALVDRMHGRCSVAKPAPP